MQNFDYQTPTRLIFGKGVIAKLPGVMAQFGKKILLTYGGGSVLDCSKAIAAGACYDGDPWDLISYKVKAKAALPIVDIITLAATGSEYDCGGVISRTETNDKIGYIDRHLYPVVSFLDPTYTFTVNKKQTAAGIADAMNHVMEQYFVEDATLLNDGFCESMFRSLMENGRKCLENPEDYTARAEMMLACTYGCNGILALGNSYSGWPCHGIEHALSAYYDITHGWGLAIITPRWMKHILNERTLPRFVKYGIDESRVGEMAHHIAVNEGLDEAYAPLTEKDIAEIITASL